MNNEELTNKEKMLLAQMEREQTPPAYLEERVTNSLKAQGLIKARRRRLKWVKWTSAIAASIILFIAGLLIGQLTTQKINTINPNQGYILLLHEDSAFKPGEPMEMFEEYSTWMSDLKEDGITINGQELTPEGINVTQAQTQPVSREERTTGYFIIEANSLEEAIEIASANPHVKYGGRIEVKPFMVR